MSDVRAPNPLDLKRVFAPLVTQILWRPRAELSNYTPSWSVHDGPLGRVVAASAQDPQKGAFLAGLAPVFGPEDGDVMTTLQGLRRVFPALLPAGAHLHMPAEKLLTDFLAGRPAEARVFGTPFEHQVWRALLDIPVGACVSYKDIACAIGKPAAARAVGGAVGRNPLFFLIPCHRVIAAGGGIGGYGWGLSEKRRLLRLEGVDL